MIIGDLLTIPVDFRIALARILYSHHVVVQLDAGDDAGLGSGVLYRVTPYQAARVLREVIAPWWRGLPDGTPPDDWSDAARLWAVHSPAVAYAVDSALWDLLGKRRGQTVAHLLGGSARDSVEVTEQIFIADWAHAEAELDAILARGTRAIKVKLGVSPAADLAAIRQVRAFVGPSVQLRVDVNHAYTWAESESLYRDLADLGVTAFEEPLHVGDWEGLHRLRETLGVPVILDESILSLVDLDAAIAAGAIDILNLKLTRVGGITLGREYIARCREHGIGVAIGCTEDLGPGMAAIVHTASSLEDCHSMEGVGPLRLGFDIIDTPWDVVNGRVPVPAGPGLGVVLREAWDTALPEAVHQFSMPGGEEAHVSISLARLWAYSRYARLRQRAENLRLRIARKVT